MSTFSAPTNPKRVAKPPVSRANTQPSTATGKPSVKPSNSMVSASGLKAPAVVNNHRALSASPTFTKAAPSKLAKG
jgi:hypothetical protein